jgi:cell division septation protein DedD/nucleoid DNA-binding protein
VTIGESIKQLLEERKRVILPGFGNLEIKESGGSISSSAKRIDPPGLIIRFDGSFSKDDGLLATAFAEAGGLKKEETEQQVLELVDAIRFALDKGEAYPLDTTGIFRRDDEGKIRFQPDASWTLEPDQYGLGSMDLFELEDLPEDEESPEIVPEIEDIEEETVLDTGPLLELSDEEDVEAEEKPAEKPVERPSEKPTPKPVAKLVTKQSSKAHSKQNPAKVQSNGETRRLSGLWRIIWIVTGILIVVLMVLLLIPGDEADPTGEKDPTQQPVQTESPETVSGGSDQSAPTLENVNPDASELDPEPEPVDEQIHDFFAIAGSFRNLANASELQDKLKARGYPAEVMITENRMYRVSVATYSTSAEAERALTGLKAEPGLESCWLLSNE